MKRHLMTKLQTWKVSARRKPLILRGVRQTGKSYLLEAFGREHFRAHHIINFEKESWARTLFEDDLEPTHIINELRFALKAEIDINQDLVIFDEIQACPRALTSLKYFCEDLPELALACAGSLLGLHLNESSYPVGKVDMMHLYPMTFSEFLNGIGDHYAAEYLDQITIHTKISEVMHKQLWERLKHYFVTGGLPEIVTIFSEYQNDLYQATRTVRSKQDELTNAYYADIAKHAGKVNAMHIYRTWQSVPNQLAANQDSSTQRFRFKGIIPKVERYSQLVNVIDWLNAAELIHKIAIIDTVQLPLQAYNKENIFKLFMFDIGILGSMGGLAPKTLLDYDFGTYKGYFAENFVAQQLVASHELRLFSWQEDRSEIEFLFDCEGDIIPIEVKSGTIIRAKSLRNYIDKYKPKKSIIFSGNNLQVNKNNSVYHLPLYLAEKVDILNA